MSQGTARGDEPVDVSDRELVSNQAPRPNTDANLFLQILAGILGTLAVYYAAGPLKGGPFDHAWEVIRNRGPIQYVALFMFFMIAAQVLLKAVVLNRQLRVLVQNPVDVSIDLHDDQQIEALRKTVTGHPRYSSSIVLNRLDRILAMWLATKDIDRIYEWSRTESERDANSSDSTYALARVVIWALPILGFIGTVFGLAHAVSGFTNFLAGAAELAQIKLAIANVTRGLGTAFDTTLLALILVTVIMFPLSFLQRREENLLVEIDTYLDDALLARLPSPEAKPIRIENLEDAIDAAFRRYIPDPDRYEEVFTRSIDRAAGTVEERFSSLLQGYHSLLKDMGGQISASMTVAAEGIGASVQRAGEEMRRQEQGLLDARRQMLREEGEKIAASLGKVDTSMKELTVGVSNVGRLVGDIESLMKTTDALRKDVEDLAKSAALRGVLEDLRKHLAVTDDHLQRMSRRRVITLQESFRA